ncbi:MAG: TRAP transporter large permease [Deltaproteobacteria bacterium]|nr:TRAP transporter large permease [Deltaproteobacteria bacterium]
MAEINIGIIGFLVLFILLLFKMHIAMAMGLIGFLGFAYVADFKSALSLLRTVPYTSMADYNLSVIPLFVLMGSFCFYAGLSKDLYDSAHKLLGQIRGGLAIATVAACAGFAAISGSSVASAATMGTVALPEMKRYNYDKGLASGSVAAGGTIGSLIPPSVALILYGIITEQSIGKLFLAGFFPGILEALFYIITIYIICRINPLLGPPGPRTGILEKISSLKNTWIVVALFVLVLGGIYLGIFSPTEAAGIGAFGSLVFGFLRGKIGWKGFKDSFIDTGKTSGMIFFILVGAMIFNYFMAVSRLPFEISEFINSLTQNRYVVITIILVIYIILGCVMDSIAMMLLTVPIFFPLIQLLNFDPIWFGILVVRVSEIGQITPPIGLNVYIIKGVAEDIPMGTIFRGVIPFIIADIFNVILLIAVPQISLFLPNLVK